jgi:hypothetical protein
LDAKPLTPLRERFESQLSGRAAFIVQQHFPFAQPLT